MAVIDLDQLRTEWHERGVVSAAKARGEDPAQALERSRRLRSWAAERGHDLRARIQVARVWAEDGNGRRSPD